MNQEIAEKWVEALRSGEYEQGRFKLHNRGSYCCLGVLCVVMEDYESLKLNKSFPLHNVMEKAGLEREEGRDLWNLNDLQHNSFSEIADYIEQHYMVRKEKEEAQHGLSIHDTAQTGCLQKL